MLAVLSFGSMGQAQDDYSFIDFPKQVQFSVLNPGYKEVRSTFEFLVNLNLDSMLNNTYVSYPNVSTGELARYQVGLRIKDKEVLYTKVEVYDKEGSEVLFAALEKRWGKPKHWVTEKKFRSYFWTLPEQNCVLTVQRSKTSKLIILPKENR